MDTTEFARITQVGLGRAVLHLQAHAAAPYHDAVLYACLHNQVYDRQVEEGREQYLFDLIRATQEPDVYRAQLLRALAHTRDEADRSQIAAVLGLFARTSDATARQGLYQAYAASAAWDTSDLPATIVQLDGVDGLLFVAEHCPPDFVDDGDPWYLVTLARDSSGPELVARQLDAGAAVSARIAAFAAAARAWDTPPPPDPYAELDAIDYDEIRRRFARGDGDAAGLLVGWMHRASDADLERVATDMLRATDPRQVRAYLRVFHRRRFPLDPGPLLAWARDENSTLAHLAQTALGQVADARVRALGLELIAQGTGHGVALLAPNYRPGDYVHLEAVVRQWQDPHQVHDLGFGLLAVVEGHPTADAVPALLALYDRGPCSMCRLHAVEFLAQLDGVPSWLRAECAYDASPRVRALMAPPTRA